MARGGIDELVGGAETMAQPSAARARVQKAPQSFGDIMSVVLTSYSSEQDYEIPGNQWMASDLPVVGDSCIVIFDDQGDAWVVVAKEAPDPPQLATARSMINWTSTLHQLTTIDRNNWTNAQLFDFVMTIVHELRPEMVVEVADALGVQDSRQMVKAPTPFVLNIGDTLGATDSVFTA